MDNTKQCWHCGKSTMLPAGNFYQCSECGATWTEQPSMEGTYLDIEPARGVMGDAKINRIKKRRRATA